MFAKGSLDSVDNIADDVFKENLEANKYSLTGEEHYDALKEVFGADNVEWTSKTTLSEADKLRIKDWEYPPDEALYIKYKNVYQNELYFDQATGRTLYPADDGFLNGTYDVSTVSADSIIDRSGSNGTGQFFSPIGTDYTSRALPPFMTEQPNTKYYVLKDFDVKSGTIAPWFGEKGGGKQFFTDFEILDKNGNYVKATVESLIENDYISPID